MPLWRVVAVVAWGAMAMGKMTGPRRGVGFGYVVGGSGFRFWLPSCPFAPPSVSMVRRYSIGGVVSRDFGRGAAFGRMKGGYGARMGGG